MPRSSDLRRFHLKCFGIGVSQPRESSGRLRCDREEVKTMKHISHQLQKLEERIAPGGCGCGEGDSHGSKDHGSKDHGSKS